MNRLILVFISALAALASIGPAFASGAIDRYINHNHNETFVRDGD